MTQIAIRSTERLLGVHLLALKIGFIKTLLAKGAKEINLVISTDDGVFTNIEAGSACGELPRLASAEMVVRKDTDEQEGAKNLLSDLIANYRDVEGTRACKIAGPLQ